MKSIAYVGMDVHQDSIEVLGAAQEGDEVLFSFRLANNEAAIKSQFIKLARHYRLLCCYEASSCGYVLYRWLKGMKIDCLVVAPSLIPQKPGDRIKTDKRDALKLALLCRAGVLTAVHVPSEEEERVRSLVRCRTTSGQDVRRFKQRLLKYLAGKNLIYRDGNNWTLRHWRYLKGLHFEGIEEIIYAQYLGQLEYGLCRLKELDLNIETVAKSAAYAQAVGLLCCLRGIATLTAMILLTEVSDFKRFAKAPHLMSYFGLVSSQYSSGKSIHLGAITKAGNSRCRWALMESAWHYKHKPAISARLKKAWRGQPEKATAIAWKAQQRLYKKFWGIARRKDDRKAVVAVARELVGFIWALMQL